MHKPLVNSISFAILLSWGIMDRLSDIRVAANSPSNTAPVHTQVYPLLVNIGITCKYPFSFDGF